ncbi:hypothetical protein F5Y07DRAFT_195611 [Xylaria sp. FL0933]|nr:hypothetical protein F5Y07DRAFT_195611 [Xylaria sp. FL0933]
MSPTSFNGFPSGYPEADNGFKADEDYNSPISDPASVYYEDGLDYTFRQAQQEQPDTPSTQSLLSAASVPLPCTPEEAPDVLSQDMSYCFNPAAAASMGWPSTESFAQPLAPQFTWDANCDAQGQTMDNYFWPRAMPSTDFTLRSSTPENLSFSAEFSSEFSELNIRQASPPELIAAGVEPCSPPLTIRSHQSDRTKHVPYAKQIRLALMSSDTHSLELQDIYQWFRENTNRAEDSRTDGWKNSIRHNLSMNGGFVKRLDDPENPEDPENKNAKRNSQSTEWFLTPEAAKFGVQSTTRFRKEAPTRRAGAGVQKRVKKPRSRSPKKDKAIETMLAGHIDDGLVAPNNTPEYGYPPNTAAGSSSTQSGWVVHPGPSVATMPAHYSYNGPQVEQSQVQQSQEPAEDESDLMWDPASEAVPDRYIFDSD